MEWQPIETAPKDIPILIALPGGNAWQGREPLVVAAEMISRHIGTSHDVWRAAGTEEYLYTWDAEPTHWMPLPEPPSVQDIDNEAMMRAIDIRD